MTAGTGESPGRREESSGRRRVLRALAGAGALALAGCSNAGTGDSTTGGDDVSATATEVPGSTTATRTASDVTVECGRAVRSTSPTETQTTIQDEDGPAVVTVGPNGDFEFDPQDVEIRAGETVRWEWDSDNHNIRVEDLPDGADWRGTPGDDGETYDEGFVYEHTFETVGQYEYDCVPHSGVHMEGAVTVEPSADSGDCTVLGENAPPRITVGPDGDFVYEPGTEEKTLVPTGTEVTFEWGSDNHNVVVDSKPAESDWAGFEEIRNEGFEATHTFTAEGRYEFFCQPHKNIGMEGEFVVGDGNPANAVVEVGPDDEEAIGPSTVVVDVGDVVEWRWRSSDHKLRVDSTPSGAQWELHHDSSRDEPYSERHQFTVPGRYEYFCKPHVGASGDAVVVVRDDE